MNAVYLTHDFSDLLISLKSGTLTRNGFISEVEIGNTNIYDAEVINSKIIREVLNDVNPKTKTEYAKLSNLRVEEIPGSRDTRYQPNRLKKIPQ